MDIKSLVGETITHIDIFDDDPNRDDEILLTTASGRKIRIYHEQDCCESVRIENTDGNWKDLIGKVLIDIDEDIDRDGQNEYCESCTKTQLTFKVDGVTVINRWIGESNGYYSESVDFAEL